MLVRPKDRVDKQRIVSTIYHISCEDSDASYVGETELSLKARFLEHRRPSNTSSEVSRHINVDEPGHTINMDSVKILGVESKWFERGVRESLHIRTIRPSLNKDRHNLPTVWDNLLKRTMGGTPAEDQTGYPDERCHLLVS